LKDYENWLSDHEAQRHRRFHFERHRHQYLLSHALLRKTLSRYAACSPAEWEFTYSEHGRPEIATAGVPDIRFNLTHTDGLSACVVTLGNSCGIDSEKLMARHNPGGVARRMFSAAEYATLQKLEGDSFLDYFYRHWTLREAYVKAIGIGITFPTKKLQFVTEEDGATRIDFGNEIDDNPEEWAFAVFRPTREHTLAVAVRADRKPPGEFRLHSATL
jgi:4'-phosphopantetheinyl transferase